MLHQGTGFPHAQNGDLLDDCEKVKKTGRVSSHLSWLSFNFSDGILQFTL